MTTDSSIKNESSAYEKTIQEFPLGAAAQELEGLPGGRGINIAHEAVVKQAHNKNANNIALRFVCENGSMQDFSFERLHELSSRFANIMQQLCINQGETITYLGGRGPEMHVALLGSLKAKLIFAPISVHFGIGMTATLLRLADPSIVISSSVDFEKLIKPIWYKQPKLRYILLTDASIHENERLLSLPLLMRQSRDGFEIPITAPDTPALLHFTSGTTGIPKAVLHSHSAAKSFFIAGQYVLDFKKDDIILSTTDPGWIADTVYGIVAPLMHGITTVVKEWTLNDYNCIDFLRDLKITIWLTKSAGLKTLRYENISHHEPLSLPDLRFIEIVGESPDADTMSWAKSALGKSVMENLLQTEAGGIIIANSPMIPYKPGSLGRPLPGIELAIARSDVSNGIQLVSDPMHQGLLLIKRGWPSMFKAYKNGADMYQQCFYGDWYITGDLVQQDEDGYYWYMGRAEDTINISGQSMGASFIEQKWAQHPAISEVAVIGVRRPENDRVIRGFVVLKQGMTSNEKLEQDIKSFVAKELGINQETVEVAFLAELPRTPNGQLLRRALQL